MKVIVLTNCDLTAVGRRARASRGWNRASFWVRRAQTLLRTLYVIGGSATYSYSFFASVEMLAMVWHVWTELNNPRVPTQRQA